MQASSQSTLSLQASPPLIAFYSCHCQVPLPPGHRFPMTKYADIIKLLREDSSVADKIDLRESPPISLADLDLVHCPLYSRRFLSNEMTKDEMRNVGFPWSMNLVNRTLASAGGSVEACRLLFTEKRRFTAQIAGGTHHAFYDRGEGFCIFNDIAIAAKVAMKDFSVKRVLVIDLDVHQGNGTAALLKDESDSSRVITFDMFADKCYPWKSRMKNTIDVPLEDGTEDEAYLGTLSSWIPKLMDFQPQLVIFQAGVDSLKGDRFGRLSLSRSGLLKRNNMVYSAAIQNNIPLLILMGGGYSSILENTIDAHADVYRSAAFRLSAWFKSEAMV